MRLRRISLLALIIAVLVATSFLGIILNFSGTSSGTTEDSVFGIPTSDTTFNGLFTQSNPDDSLPHYEYQRIKDSMDRQLMPLKMANQSVGSGFSFGSIGVFKIPRAHVFFSENIKNTDPQSRLLYDSMMIIDNSFQGMIDADSIKKLRSKLNDITDRYNDRTNKVMTELQNKVPVDHYFALNGYSFTHSESKFFVRNNRNYLAVVNWDNKGSDTDNSPKTGRYVRKQIPVRYSEGDKRILIPVTKGQYNVQRVVFVALVIARILLVVYFFFGLPIQVLINISKGQAFTQKNIFHLRAMTYVMFIYACLSLFTPYILRLFFWRMIPSDFELGSFWHALVNNLYLFIIAAILMMISVAFHRAHLLQRENELTV